MHACISLDFANSPVTSRTKCDCDACTSGDYIWLSFENRQLTLSLETYIHIYICIYIYYYTPAHLHLANNHNNNKQHVSVPFWPLLRSNALDFLPIWPS